MSDAEKHSQALLAGASYCDLHKTGQCGSWSGSRCAACIRVVIDRAIAAARAAGFAEGVVAAADKAMEMMRRLNTDYRGEIDSAIRALAPAATTEEP